MENKGLVAYWPMDEGEGSTVRDLSGNGLHGRIDGPTWTQGRSGAALEFRPEGKGVEIESDPRLDIQGDITISAWLFKHMDNASRKPRWDAVVSRCPKAYVDADHIHYELMISGVNPDEISFFSNSTTPPCGWSGNKIPIGEWFHVGFVRKGDRGQFFLNGSPTDRYRVQTGYGPGHQGEGEGFLVTDIEIAGEMLSKPSSPQNLYIGWDGCPDFGMEGKISDVYLYDRALTDEEMKSLSGV